MRLHIIGVPSAGKTTLAAGIADALHLPHHDLDAVAFTDERWTMRSLPQRRAMIDEIVRQPGSVTEGGFLGWTQPLLDAADRIIWLDPPLHVLLWRHLRRHARHPHRLPSLLAFQWRSYRQPAGAGPATDDPNQTRAGIDAALRPYEEKVIRLKRAPSVRRAIESLRLSGTARGDDR